MSVVPVVQFTVPGWAGSFQLTTRVTPETGELSVSESWVIVASPVLLSHEDEYEPLGGIDSSYGMGESKPSASKRLTEGAASVAGSVSSSASKLADSLHNRSTRGSSESMSDMDGDAGSRDSRM